MSLRSSWILAACAGLALSLSACSSMHGIVSRASPKRPQFAYVAHGDNSVLAYRINATTGALTLVPGSPFAAGNAPHSVAIDPTVSFATVANTGGNTISTYLIDPTTGALSTSPGSLSTGTNPTAVTFSPDGNFLLVTNGADNTVWDYRVTNILSAISGGSAPVVAATGNNPVSVVVAQP